MKLTQTADHIAASMKAAIDMGHTKTIKKVEVEWVLAMEKPKSRVGDPSRRTPPQPPAEKLKEETSKGPPGSLEEVIERIAYFLPGHSEIVVVSDRGDYYRVGRRRMMDKEIENHVNMVVATMGGTWDKEANCWKIPKGS